MKKLVLILLVLTSTLSFATNYYVNVNAANNNGSGTTPETAFKYLSTAANKTQPGDFVYIMPGTYYPDCTGCDVLDIYWSGTAGKYITYKAYDNANRPVFQLTASSWQGIYVQGAKYIIIDGIIVRGNNDNVDPATAAANQNASTKGTGISVAPKYGDASIKSDHVIIRNCNISKCGASGISIYNSDYITVDTNIVSNCAWYSADQTSGINIFQLFNSDTTTGTKNYVRRNTCFNNKNLVPNNNGNITDGNGIIFDDLRNTQLGSANGQYTGKSYVANNVCYNNGSKGFHAYLSDKITVINNTCYKNCTTPEIRNNIYDSEYSAAESGNMSFINNIAFPDTDVPPIKVEFYTQNNPLNVNNVINKNLWYVTGGALPANPAGTNALSGDPKFVNAATNNFRLQSTSPAINAGVTSGAPTIDRLGNTRTGGIDIGAYEYIAPAAREFEAQEVYTPDTLGYNLYPNPTANELVVQLDNANTLSSQITVVNQFGQKVIDQSVAVDNGNAVLNVTELPTGIYFISVNGNLSQSKKFIKE
jgi:parallel beta-helix repeat protein